MVSKNITFVHTLGFQVGEDVKEMLEELQTARLGYETTKMGLAE